MKHVRTFQVRRLQRTITVHYPWWYIQNRFSLVRRSSKATHSFFAQEGHTNQPTPHDIHISRPSRDAWHVRSRLGSALAGRQLAPHRSGMDRLAGRAKGESFSRQ